MVELIVMGGVGLAIGGWLLSRRGHRPIDAGIDPVFTPYETPPPGCATTDDRDVGAASELRTGDAVCGPGDGNGDGDADCGASEGGESSDGGSDGGSDGSSD